MIKKIAVGCFISSTIAMASVIHTPMDRVFKNDQQVFKGYALYITKYRGGAAVVKKLIARKSAYMGFYEAILKSLYQRYVEKKEDSQYWKNLALMLYDRQSRRLKDTIEGVYVQNMLLEIGEIKKARGLISNPYFCLTLKRKNDAYGCFANNILIQCLLKEKEVPVTVSLTNTKNLNDLHQLSFKMCSNITKEAQ